MDGAGVRRASSAVVVNFIFSFVRSVDQSISAIVCFGGFYMCMKSGHSVSSQAKKDYASCHVLRQLNSTHALRTLNAFGRRIPKQIPNVCLHLHWRPARGSVWLLLRPALFLCGFVSVWQCHPSVELRSRVFFPPNNVAGAWGRAQLS